MDSRRCEACGRLLYDDRRLCSICDPQDRGAEGSGRRHGPISASARDDRDHRDRSPIEISFPASRFTWAIVPPPRLPSSQPQGPRAHLRRWAAPGTVCEAIIQAVGRDAAVKSGLRAIKAGIQSWFVDHGVYPTADQVKDSQDGIAAYMDAWPTNPFSSLPMSQGDAPGDYTYVQTISGYGFTLTGHLHAGGGDFVLP